jgi:hypothetical protein
MAKIISLHHYRDLNALRIGYSHWRRKFREDFNARTGLSDLSPATLCQLAEPGDESANALYALIIGFLGYRPSETFDSLDSPLQSIVLDIHLFMADQIRFEMLYRLGWIESWTGRQFPFFEMVKEFERVKRVCQEQPPRLAKSHPQWDEYHLLIHRDKQIFIRRMLVPALEAFKSANKL